MSDVKQRFLRYVSFDTQSQEGVDTCPSTPGQLVLGEALVEEMRQMGISDAHMDAHGYVYGTVPGDPRLPTVGLIAHMDTSCAAPGRDVKPRVVAYEGGDICLNQQEDIWLRQRDYPTLANHVGKHLIVTDGTTLLGADDKAGVAEILAAAEILLKTRMIHATVKIGFTPDEEVGKGADLFDLEKFGADYAYTVDGGPVGGIEYENFNGAFAYLTVHGVGIHPGDAKNKMKNAMTLAMEFHSQLPADQVPEKTEGYEGFFHLMHIEGDVEQARLRYIIRDHDLEKFQQKKDLFHAIGKKLEETHGPGVFVTETKDTYYNMKQCIEPHLYVVDRAKAAMAAAGMVPQAVPIRGGTDGARLSYMGLPCPNLCTGGENYHSRFEFVPLEDMEQCVEMLVQLMTTF